MMSFHTLRVRAHEFTQNRGTFHRSRCFEAKSRWKTGGRTLGNEADSRGRLSLQEKEDAATLGIILTAPSERGLPSQTGGGAFGRCKNRISNRRARSPSVTLTRATSLPEGGSICSNFEHYSLFIFHYSLLFTLSTRGGTGLYRFCGG